MSRVWLLPNLHQTHLQFFCWGKSEQLRAKLLNTLPGGPALGEEPGQLLGWGGGLATPSTPLKASPTPKPTRTLHSQTGLLGKLTIDKTFLLSLCRPPSPGPLHCPLSGPPKPAGPLRQPQTSQDGPGVLTYLLGPPPLLRGSGTWALALPSSYALSQPGLLPAALPESVPLPPGPAWRSWLSGEVGSELPLGLLGPGVGPMLKGYTPFLNTLPPPTPEGVVQAGAPPAPPS